MINKILEIIFPNVCGICGKIDKHNLCPQCKIKLKKLIKANITKMSNKNFTNHAYLFTYGGIIREKIIKYKFKDSAYLYKTFAEIIIKNKKMCGFIKNYDIIIPVPIHKKRYKERGYNQSELLASEIAKTLNISIEKRVLIKNVNNTPQSKLSKIERKNNANGVYKIINAQKIKNKKIIIIDDIYTTGSTANECSKLLKQAGASEIAVFTIAKD